MSAADAFLQLWRNARDTHGDGAPVTGEEFDSSAQLRGIDSQLQATKPDDRWTGTAADNYAQANAEQRRIIGRLADLDEQLADKVTQAADVVATGRTNLDTVRANFAALFNSLPPGRAGETLSWKLLGLGAEQISEVVQRSNDDLSRIGRDIARLGSEYETLGNKQKFASGEGDEEGDSDKEEDGEDAEGDDDQVQQQAEEDVRRTLNDGDQEAAARVDEVLSSIVPGQELTPTQKAYLDQMADQQANMSVEDLERAQDRLGDHKNVIGDSWQLMSNDDVRFGEPDENGNLRAGSFDRLPESVQRALSIANLDYPATGADRDRIETIAEIVRNGDQKFQTGTEIDREMIRLSDRLMDQSPVNEKTVRELFTSAGRDHQVVTDHLVGWQPHLEDPNAPDTVPYDYNSDDFLMDIMRMGWSDDGRDAAGLFNWTHDAANGSAHDQQIASAAAERYAQFLGAHKDELLNIKNMWGHTDTLGQVNPELVRGMAHGLTPYMADIAGVDGGALDNFDPLDGGDQTRPLAKGVFAVLGSDVEAYREFYGAANELALQKSFEWATDVKGGVEVFKDDARMNAAATLKGLIDYGTAEGLKTIAMDNNEMTELKKAVYNKAVAALAAAGGPYGKAISFFGSALEESFFGNGSDIAGNVKPMFGDEAARFAANALLAAGVEMPGAERYLVWDTDADGQRYQRFGTIEELKEQNGITVTPDTYGADLNRWLDQIVGEARNPSGPFGEQYDDVTQ